MTSTRNFSLERFDVTEIGSITALFAVKGYSSGIFVLRFADGEAYAAHSQNVPAHFLAARDEWDDIETIEFTAGSAGDAVALAELVSRTAALRTLTTTANANANANADEVEAVPDAPREVFPNHRAHRITMSAGVTSDRRRRYWELSDHIAYPAIRGVVADYINSTIPDPANTQKYLWNVTAVPSTSEEPNRRRLLTLTCGALETLQVVEITHDDDSIELDLRINTDVPDGKSDAELEISNETVSAGRGPYAAERVWSWSIDLGALMEEDVDVELGLDDDTFDDLAYALNARLMARPSSLRAVDHNQDLANDLLAEAYRQIYDPE